MPFWTAPSVEESVLDVFAGSGTTLIAAQKNGRRGYGIEIDPHYVDTTLRRFEEVYGLKAVHAQLNITFDQLTDQRVKENRHGDKKANEDTKRRAEGRAR
jgi:adenine specific DNA methylase Mod